MGQTDAIFFWADGIVHTPLQEAVAAALPGMSAEAIARYFASPAYKAARENLALGGKPAEFCMHVLDALHVSTGAETMEAGIIAALAVYPQALELIGSLEPGIRSWLVVDIPRTWFERLPFAEELVSRFSRERMLFLEDAGLTSLVPGVFEYLVAASGTERERCLLLDSSLRRAMAALDAGLPAGIIVGTRRLQREFLLRRLISQQYVMHSRPV